jgi:hypothetical protein
MLFYDKTMCYRNRARLSRAFKKRGKEIPDLHTDN